jgi:exodeoxyribonuclease-5
MSNPKTANMAPTAPKTRKKLLAMSDAARAVLSAEPFGLALPSAEAVTQTSEPRAHELSEDQAEALRLVHAWIEDGGEEPFKFAGNAGTGKSYCMAVLAKELRGLIAFCAFTGKAASVLARKLAQAGISTTSKTAKYDPDGEDRTYDPRPYCGTIHGLMYRPCPKCMDDGDAEPDHTAKPGCKAYKGTETVDVSLPAGWVSSCPACDAEASGKPPPAPTVRTPGPCSGCNDARFLRRDELDRPYGILIVDEASMVSDEILETMKRHHIPILAVGDHGQLQPVRGTGSLMLNPHVKLEKIHRQAEGNPIIMLSKRIRETGDIDDSLEDGDCFSILPRRNMDAWIAERYTAARLVGTDPTAPAGIMSTAMITWTNKMRVVLNQSIRGALGTAEGPPSAGEVVVCLKNKPPAYNGMRAVLAHDGKQGGGPKTPKVAADLWFVEDGMRIAGVSMSELQFFAEKTLDWEFTRELGVSFASLGDLYDFGYALTAHKFQGSQCPEVGVLIEPGMFRMSKSDRTRWIYTSCTRASAKLTVIR